MIEVEKHGIPTVAWFDAGFDKDASMTAKAFGAKGLALGVLPGPSAQLTVEQVQKQVADAIDQIIDGLTKPVTPFKSEEAAVGQVLTIQGDDLLDAEAKMNRQFLDEGWSDGFPLVAPTKKAIEWMLSGTRLNRDEVIAVLEPGFGKATVEKIAINAVMAGCRPEHMPLLITVVRCISDPKMTLRRNVMSTGGNGPFILVNGPIIKKLGLNSKCSTLDPGSVSHNNIVIGRALSLMILNIAHGYPGEGSMSTIGNPMNYTLCAAENEEESPWEPYHVEKGFDKDTSTVTIMFVRGGTTYGDLTSNTAEQIAKAQSWVASGAMNTAAMWLASKQGEHLAERQGTRKLFLLCPAHVSVLAREGWDKKRLREYLYNHTKLPLEILMFGKDISIVRREHPQLVTLLADHPEVQLPLVSSPDSFEIAVVGGVGPCSSCFEGHGDIITLPIEE